MVEVGIIKKYFEAFKYLIRLIYCALLINTIGHRLITHAFIILQDNFSGEWLIFY